MDLRSKSEYFDKNMVVHLMSAFGILYIFQIIWQNWIIGYCTHTDPIDITNIVNYGPDPYVSQSVQGAQTRVTPGPGPT